MARPNPTSTLAPPTNNRRPSQNSKWTRTRSSLRARDACQATHLHCIEFWIFRNWYQSYRILQECTFSSDSPHLHPHVILRAFWNHNFDAESKQTSYSYLLTSPTTMQFKSAALVLLSAIPGALSFHIVSSSPSPFPKVCVYVQTS